MLAHVPDLNDFVAGMQAAARRGGVITLEFPHLLRLIEERQFDTIYHEHFSYFSLLAVERSSPRTACGSSTSRSCRPTAARCGSTPRHASDGGSRADAVDELREREEARRSGATSTTYTAFGERVRRDEARAARVPDRREARRASRSSATAPPRRATRCSTTAAIGADFVDYVVDRSPHKQGLFLPGSRIPVYPPERIAETRPDYLLILAWNLKDEIVEQMAHVRERGGRFVTPVPHIQVHE